MKGRLIFAIGGGVVEAGGGIVINAIWGDLLWLGYLLIVVGFISIAVGLSWGILVRLARWLKLRIGSIFNVLKNNSKADRFLKLEAEQRKNPTKFLLPVIDHIDVNRQGIGAKKDEVFIRFRIDSHLLFPINEYYVSVKLCFRDESLNTRPEVEANAWYEIKQKGNIPPIRQLERYLFTQERMQIGGEDGALLKMLAKAKKNRRVLAKLKIGIAFRAKDKENPIPLEGSHWVAPMSNYRGG